MDAGGQANRVAIPQTWLARTVDAAVVDGRKTFRQRLAVSALAAAVLQASLGATPMLWWMLALHATEVLTARVTRGIGDTVPGTSAQRAWFLGHVALSTMLWSLVPVWMWLSRNPGLQAVAAIIVCAQLIHAQGFAYRSRIVLALSAGIPAATITMLTLGWSGLTGLDLVTAIAGLALTFGYVVAGARTNILNARLIEASRRELEAIAYTDALTTLANRRRFSESFGSLVRHSRQHRTPFALILVDLDGLKTINDELGHDIGDEVLVAVADRLRQLADGDHRVARLGGDEFALLLGDVAGHAQLEAACRRVAAALAVDQLIGGRRLRATASIGAALFPDHGDAPETLFKAADLALYDAKNSGRNTWRAFDPAREAAQQAAE